MTVHQINRHERRRAAAFNGKKHSPIVKPFAPVRRPDSAPDPHGPSHAGFFVGGPLAGMLRVIPADRPVIEVTAKREKLILEHPGAQPFEILKETYNVYIVQPMGVDDALALCVLHPNDFVWGMRELMSAYVSGLAKSVEAVDDILNPKAPQ